MINIIMTGKDKRVKGQLYFPMSLHHGILPYPIPASKYGGGILVTRVMGI